MPDPVRIDVRMYQVGFGDCFLVSFGYDTALEDGRSERHMLIDFGSTRRSPGGGDLEDVARLVAEHAHGQLDAIVLSHRHKDHLSGFAVDAAAGIIEGLQPRLVIRPWTEDPDAAADSRGPGGLADGSRRFEWEETFKRWAEAGRRVPPAMIVVCNDTKMAEILEKHIAEMGEAGPELVNPDGAAVTVRIDSKLLAEAEIREEAETAQDAAERIREVVATVGKEDEPGEQVRCLISVAMLSEGWDARNVTQILGLRAFDSQLLCEQVVGRGLRRTDYTSLSEPEYVDVYGVPFQLLPFAKGGAGTPIEPPKTTVVRTVPERADRRLEFPRVVQIVPDVGDTLEIDLDSIEPVQVSAEFDPTTTYVEFEAGEPGYGLGLEVQDRSLAYERFRMQRLHFRLAAAVIRPYDKPWLFPQALKIVRDVVERKVTYGPGVDRRELCNLRYLKLLEERIENALRSGQGRTQALLPVLDEYEPIASTEGIAFSTAKPCEPTAKSHISHVVYDSKLELEIARELERDERVESFAKNDRLFLEIPYRHLGRTLRYRPDFLVRLSDETMLLIEGKGRRDEKDDSKWTAARRWVAAVNSWGKLGRWTYAVCYKRAEVGEVIAEAMAGAAIVS